MKNVPKARRNEYSNHVNMKYICTFKNEVEQLIIYGNLICYDGDANE